MVIIYIIRPKSIHGEYFTMGNLYALPCTILEYLNKGFVKMFLMLKLGTAVQYNAVGTELSWQGINLEFVV